jgi:hypothetical protein
MTQNYCLKTEFPASTERVEQVCLKPELSPWFLGKKA